MTQKFKKIFILRTCGIVLSFSFLMIAIILFMVWVFSMNYVSGKSSSNKVALAFAITFVVLALIVGIVGACFEKKYKAMRDENDREFVKLKVYE